MISVLIADDETLVRSTLRKLIPWQELGVEAVYEAEDGLRGLALAKEYRPSIIISDIKMPHLNGMEFARAVRREIPQTRLVFLSGYTDKEYLKGAIDLHVDGYIEKPLNLPEISQLIKKLAGESRQAQAAANPNLYFYRGDVNAGVLNGEVFVLSKPALASVGQHLKARQKEAAVKELRALCAEMRRCEGTQPDYVRNVFSQLALQLESAAGFHGARKAQAAGDHFVYATAQAECLDALEAELFRITEMLFDEISARDFDPVALVNDYLQKNFSDSLLTVDGIARHLNFNTSYLCALYKRKTGRTINAALTAARLELACMFLRDSSMKLYEIGARVGYPNGRYFTKVFTKEIGVPPRQYRECHYG